MSAYHQFSPTRFDDIVLPDAVANNGVTISVKRTDNNSSTTLTMASAGGNIEGAATQTIGNGMCVTYCSNGADWWELSNS